MKQDHILYERYVWIYTQYSSELIDISRTMDQPYSLFIDSVVLDRPTGLHDPGYVGGLLIIYKGG